MKLYICEDCKRSSLAFAKKCICDFIGERERGIEIEFARNEYGKPYVREICKNIPGDTKKTKKIKMDVSVHFSLSHSESMTVCAVARFAIGADCQKRLPKRISACQKIAGRFYSAQENIYLDSMLPDEERYVDNFFSIWAKKEAYIKYTGKGMAEGLGTFSVVGENMQESHVCFKRIYLENAKKNDFYIYLCCNNKNKNKISEVKKCLMSHAWET